MFAAGVGAAASGVAALGTAAINSYADYEQLVGGVETLFKDSADIVSEYADNAYKSAGLSANAYMETVTSFSASLLQSLDGDTAAAAESANQAIIDMSDNANKMGTSMESIQNAYQGFAKQNYTMLDNLKLGYGGTKEEMQRLLEDAEKLSGQKYDISNLNDVYSAIHVIQTELGITGTTAKEACTTISRSVNAMKASWTNLVTGIADDNADFDALIDNFVDSAVTVGENLIPRIEIAIGGIGKLIEKMLPIILDKVPEIIGDILPDLLNSGTNLIISLAEGIQENLPLIAESGGEILSNLIDGIIQLAPSLGTIAFDLVSQLLTGISENSGSVLSSGSELLLEFANGISEKIPDLISMAIGAIVSLALALTEPKTLGNIITAGIQIILSLVEGILKSIPKLLAAVPVIFKNVYDAFLEIDWASIGSNIIDGIWNGISAGWNWLVDSVKNIAGNLLDAAKEVLGIHSPSTKFKYLGEMCVAGFDEGMEDLMNPDDMAKNINASLSTAQANMAGSKSVGAIGGFSGFNQTINVNQPISTPDELARAVRVESRQGLMIGVAYG